MTVFLPQQRRILSFRRNTPPLVIAVCLLLAPVIFTGCSDATPAAKSKSSAVKSTHAKKPGKRGELVTVGLIFRRQFHTNPYHKRWLRHVDMILADGSLRSYGRLPGTRRTSLGHLFRYDPGRVWNEQELSKRNPFETDIAKAKANRYEGILCPDVSEWVSFTVTREQADRLKEAWDNLAKATPPFRLWGQNCATRTDRRMAEAGIFSRAGLVGIDRPYSLLYKLQREIGTENLRTRVGYFGYDKNKKPVIEELPATQ